MLTAGDGWRLAVFPILFNVLVSLVAAVVYNRLTERHYPHPQRAAARTDVAQGLSRHGAWMWCWPYGPGPAVSPRGHHIPIVDADDRLLGVITWTDLVRTLALALAVQGRDGSPGTRQKGR